jgi:AcrR family transcriptional regulator
MAVVSSTDKKGRPRRLTREEKSEQIKHLLIDAAAEVVGKYGYADASVGRITEAARVAQGTFYNYFETRQDIFDLLPPRYAEKMLQYISLKMDRRLEGLEREVKRFELFFDFFYETTESARLVNEAPVMAPVGFAHFSRIVKDNYTIALKRSMDAGEIARMDPDKLADIVDILIAIRNGLSQPRQAPALKRKRVSPDLVNNYRDFIKKALFDKHD